MDLTPWRPGSWFVPLAEFSASATLRTIMRHEFEDEQPAVFMRRHGWFSERPRFAREWGMGGGGFGRGGFGRMMGMGF